MIDAITLSKDPHFFQAVEQTIDALCFFDTHIVDRDFRAHSKTSYETIKSLQDEQGNRISAMYGPLKPTPDFIAAKLQDLYGVDAANILHTKEIKESNVVDAMTEITAKVFKKEMKIRIHEWESAFHDMYGREPTPQDKQPLHGIYALYKTVKLKVQQEGAGGVVVNLAGHTPDHPISGVQVSGLSTDGPFHHPATSQPQTQLSSHHIPLDGQSGSASRVVPRQPTSSLQTQNVRPTAVQPPPQPSTTISHQQYITTPNRVSTAPSSSQTPKQPASGGTLSPATIARSSAGTGPTPSTILDAAGGNNDFSVLMAEKRQLKRKLHQFEGEFEVQNGRAPTKDDRKVMSKEYHRYGELKIILAQMGQKEN